MAFILDASVALTWLFKDERTKRTTSLLRRVVDEGAIVPPLWHYEISSGLLLGIRRKRLTVDIVRDRLNLLVRLQLEVDPHVPARFPAIVELAEAAQLTVYDATYLELALRQNLPLATNDGPLTKAAKSRNVVTL